MIIISSLQVLHNLVSFYAEDFFKFNYNLQVCVCFRFNMLYIIVKLEQEHSSQCVNILFSLLLFVSLFSVLFILCNVPNMSTLIRLR